MNLVLHPRAAPPDQLRFWLGAFQATTAPTLQWFLDGAPAAPTALRAMASVRTTGQVDANQPRAFAGVFEFANLVPDRTYRVRVEAAGQSAEFTTRTLPAAVPATLDGSFNVLLVSCFHQAEDRKGLAGTIVSQLPPAYRPHLTLLMGDQVYLDLPTLKDFPDDEVWLARKFEEDYGRNWQGTPGYAQILDAAPSVALPDDHEFWNNYPHVSPMIGNSWKEEGRGRWQRAARALYQGFQQPYPATPDDPAIIEVEPLSFFLPDMRSQRDPGRAFLLTAAAHQKLGIWIDDLIARRRYGVFVTGQSLFTNPVGDLSGAVADYELPNYGDYGRIVKQLERVASAGLPLLCLTGDVHWGRMTQSTDGVSQRTAIYEIISSPSSLVTTVGFDTAKVVGSWFAGLFGRKNPWPRHADPERPPDYLAPKDLGVRFANKMLHGQRGNHVALLRFARQGGALSFRVQYWPLSRDAAVIQPPELGPFLLRSDQPPTP